MRRRIFGVLLLLALATGAGWVGGYAASSGRNGAPGAKPSGPVTRLVPIVRTNLRATQTVSGTVGRAATWAVGAASGTTPDQVLEAQDSLSGAKDHLTAVKASASASAASARATIAADESLLAAATASGDTAAISAAQYRLSADRAQSSAASASDTADLNAATAAVAAAQRALDADLASESFGGRTLTALPDVGTDVAQGQALFSVDGRPVVLLTGQTPMYRPLREGISGDDVRQLQRDLVSLGSDPTLTVDGSYGATTAAAVKAWQTSLGLTASGAILHGEVVFLPDAVTVSAVNAVAGQAYSSSQTILEVVPQTPSVTIDLDPSLQSAVKVGDSLDLALPTGGSASATIAAIASVAAVQAGPGAGSGQLAIRVTATPTQPGSLAHLDGATVTTSLTTATADNVLAVPVDSLVALAGGGYGVEIDDAGARRYVAVTPGLYADTLVAISGNGLAPGMNVVAPAQ